MFYSHTFIVKFNNSEKVKIEKKIKYSLFLKKYLAFFIS